MIRGVVKRRIKRASKKWALVREKKKCYFRFRNMVHCLNPWKTEKANTIQVTDSLAVIKPVLMGCTGVCAGGGVQREGDES